MIVAVSCAIPKPCSTGFVFSPLSFRDSRFRRGLLFVVGLVRKPGVVPPLDRMGQEADF